MKIAILSIQDVVLAAAIVPYAWVSVAHPDGVRSIELPDTSPVAVGWHYDGPPPAPPEPDPNAEPDANVPLPVVPAQAPVPDRTCEFSPPPPVHMRPTLSAGAFYELFEIAEAVAIKGSPDPEVIEIYSRLQLRISEKTPMDCNDPRVEQMLQGLVAKGLIAPDRVERILSGLPPI